MTDQPPLEVAPEDATTRQLLAAIYRQGIRLEQRMSELSAEVDQLDGVAQRLLPQLQALEAQRDSLSADAAAAVDNIRNEVDQLNAMGADPTTPVAGSETPPTT
jgi:TolA-binding protein